MKRNKNVSKSRCVSYKFYRKDELHNFNCEEVLAKTKAAGIIIEYDDGRDRDPWFNAVPGAQARSLRDVFLNAGYLLIPQGE
jgi:hypothetical protein